MKLTWLSGAGGGGQGGGGGAGSQEAGAGPHFLLQNFFPSLPPLKPRCILWSSASYILKNTLPLLPVSQEAQRFVAHRETTGHAAQALASLCSPWYQWWHPGR